MTGCVTNVDSIGTLDISDAKTFEFSIDNMCSYFGSKVNTVAMSNQQYYRYFDNYVYSRHREATKDSEFFVNLKVYDE